MISILRGGLQVEVRRFTARCAGVDVVAEHLAAMAERIERLIAALGRAVMWLALFVVLGEFAVVLLRYVFGIGSLWLAESVIYAHATLFLLAAGWTLQANGHVRVDVFYSDASPRARARVDLFGALLLLLPFVAVIAWFSLPYAARSWAVLEVSREASGLPFVYLLKSLIPLFAVLLGLAGLAQAIRAALVLRSPPVTPGLDRSSQDGLPGQSRQ
jgi:TRAP-type mannitol/chloroaromatic compound transport system permease small subunit